MKILVIEDNKDILINVVDYLSIKGYDVDCAQNGITGLNLATENFYDLIVLDIMLPGMDGLEVCKLLRSDPRKTVPIIMLTARDSIDDRIAGFKTGADDYLIKPFALAELVARIEAVIRRSQGVGQYLLQVGDLIYNLDTFVVQRAGVTLKLTPLALKLLEVLMKKSPNVVRREILEQQVWGDEIPDTDILRSHIHQLRQIIDKPFDKPLLHTIPKLGYKLAESVDAP
ncbi:response regulator transcription factor [Entomomonas asaccharolytica]|uniref:Response regulator transcription factor n=1 Tax=Entomomonas asaccharolytica TaxID=2785331 RepID=A0A974RWM6_9GAMM|nr:response regulator transcription factor [Entomomonas asaccharolytica]QQP85340.1 response regulator transcription factor [Entomomonas asaccharolytica]